MTGDPRELYMKPTLATFRGMRRVLKVCVYVLLSGGALMLAGFEAWHLYLESYQLGAPSRAPLDPEADPYGWQEERAGWTGGLRGGTDPRLGQRVRHALRAAWTAQHWGSGNELALVDSVRGSGVGLHGARLEDYRIDPREAGGGPDEGYALAVVYLDMALDKARAKGWAFPPNLSTAAGRAGPPDRLGQGDKDVEETVRELLVLKAGALERVGGAQATDDAREIYEALLRSTREEPGTQARTLRLAGKVGDLSARLGQAGEAEAWWAWGLGRAGVQVLELPPQEVKHEKKGWFGFLSKSEVGPDEPWLAPQDPQTAALAQSMSPAVLRATVSLLSSAEAHYAQTAQLDRAAAAQHTALALLGPPGPFDSALTGNGHRVLHETWLEQRRAVLELHHATVLYAQGKSSLPLANEAANEAENALAALQPLPAIYDTPKSVLRETARSLRRDALLTAAEAAYTRGFLLEKQKKPSLEDAADSFERAMEVYELDLAEGEEPRGKDWERYWRAFTRVKEKMGQEVVPRGKGAEKVSPPA